MEEWARTAAAPVPCCSGGLWSHTGPHLHWSAVLYTRPAQLVRQVASHNNALGESVCYTGEPPCPAVAALPAQTPVAWRPLLYCRLLAVTQAALGIPRSKTDRNQNNSTQPNRSALQPVLRFIAFYELLELFLHSLQLKSEILIEIMKSQKDKRTRPPMISFNILARGVFATMSFRSREMFQCRIHILQ